MKAASADAPPTDPGWCFEIKWDGVRILADVAPDHVQLWSANGKDVSRSYPELVGLPDAIGGRRALLDGEVVAFDDAGRPSFGALQRRMHVADAREAVRRAEETPVVYQVFDLLLLDGNDLMELPLTDRRRVLDQLFEPGPCWQLSPIHADGDDLLEAAKSLGLEGIVAKRADSRYLPGKRSPVWRKVKVRNEQEFVVGGWSEGTGNREGHLGSLLVGYYDAPGRLPLRYAGRVGTGFTQGELERLGRLLAPLATEDCPFDPAPNRMEARGAHWVRPEVVVQVAYGEWTGDGRLRHPAYLGERTDKDAAEVTADP
jgi:bifunctional non-homologous end joining protein LigD